MNERFGPSTKLSDILTASKRRAFWAGFASESNLKYPALYRPAWVVVVNTLVAILAAFRCDFFFADSQPFLFQLVFWISALAFGRLIFALSTPLATKYSPAWSNFRGLSEEILALNIKEMKKSQGPMGRNDIWVILRNTIVTQLGVEPADATRDANFVTDLGCN